MFRDSAVSKVVAVWRAPERLTTCPKWPTTTPGLMDVTVFGETGLFAARRGEDGKYAGIKPGPQQPAPSRVQAQPLIEAARTLEGTLALRGPMVPHHAFPGALEPDRELPRDAFGFVDTGYPCRFAPGSGTLVITGPPAGIVSVGGCRFVLSRLQDTVSRIEAGAMIAAFPDGLAGQRIAGIAGRREEVRDALTQLGHSPLVVDAFRQRGADVARSAA